MIVLLHGDNLVNSRKALDSYKLKAVNKEIVTLRGDKIDETQLLQALESNSLFNDNKIVIIEGLLSRKKNLNWEKALKSDNANDLIIWEPKEISKTVIKKLPNQTQIYLYKISPVIFKFLESIYPGNEIVSLQYLHECQKTDEPEMIFFMITRQIRNLLIARDLGSNSPGFSPWQLVGLTKQGKYFTMDKLRFMHKKLLTIDVLIKTGTAPYDLTQLIEQFIINTEVNDV